MSHSTFLLDANVFIEAHRRYYGFDICPGFWSALLHQHGLGRIFSLDKVRDELLAGNDELCRWSKEVIPATFFKESTDSKVVDEFRGLARWVQGNTQFTQEAKAEFSSVADGWLVAYAKPNEFTVVTQEVYRPDSKRIIPLPNVCIKLDVVYCNTFDMLRKLQVELMLRQ